MLHVKKKQNKKTPKLAPQKQATKHWELIPTMKLPGLLRQK